MHIMNRSNRIVKSTVLGATAFVVMMAPAAAFAHGNNGFGNDHRANLAVSQKNDDKRSNSNWWWNHDRQHKTCEERQMTLNQKAADAKDKSQKRLNGVNIMLNGVETYVAGGVTVENYETMHTTAVTNQTNATNAVNAIAAPDLNCSDDNAAATESDDKGRMQWRDNNMNDTVNNANKALKTYGKSVNVLFEAAVNS